LLPDSESVSGTIIVYKTTFVVLIFVGAIIDAQHLPITPVLLSGSELPAP
jgi:hypothetical protein